MYDLRPKENFISFEWCFIEDILSCIILKANSFVVLFLMYVVNIVLMHV